MTDIDTRFFVRTSDNRWGYDKTESAALKRAHHDRSVACTEVLVLSAPMDEWTINWNGDVQWKNPDCKVVTRWFYVKGKRVEELPAELSA
jgi:hypothetical protein